MTELDKEDVLHLADLARIQLTDVEAEDLVVDLAVIIRAVSTVQRAVAGDVEATSHPIPLANVFRRDVANAGIRLSPEQALSGAPEREGDYFRIAPILEE